MGRLIRLNRINAFPTLLILLSLSISGCESRYENLDISVYQYRDTKDFVKFVYDASQMIKKDGLKSVEFFKNNSQMHYAPDRYLYIYYMNGVNIYHAGMPHLEGKNLWELKDKNGKKPLSKNVD
ncbi:MAG: cache domain-containing protein [Smithella sp.]